MARRFATNIDLSGFALLGAMLNPVTSDPSSPNAGQVWYRSDVPTLKFWNGATAVDLLARAQATGSQTASTISDFVSAVQAVKWSTMVAPTTAVPMNSENFSGLAAASASGQAVEYAQFTTALANLQAGLDFKSPSVTVVATTNITLGTPGATISGHTMAAGDSVLLTGQTTASQNGIYNWNGASSTLTRRTAAGATDVYYSGTMVSITAADGTNPDTVWMQTAIGTGTGGAITFGTDAQTWVKPFATATYTGSATIGVSLGVISAILASGGGLVGGSGLAIDPSVVLQKVGGIVPTATTGKWTISGAVAVLNHGLNNWGINVTVRAYSSPASGYTAYQEVELDCVPTDANNVSITFPATLVGASNAWIVQVEG